MILGDRLRELRKEKGLTLKQLETKTGISLPYLSEVEREVSYPTIKVLSKLASFYKLTLSELMGGITQKELQKKTLPKGLQELIEDKNFEKHFSGERGKELIRTLQRVEYRGRRPQTKEEWIQLFYALKSIKSIFKNR